MADLKNHSLDGSNEKAVERLRQFIEDNKQELEEDKKDNKN